MAGPALPGGKALIRAPLGVADDLRQALELVLSEHGDHEVQDFAFYTLKLDACFYRLGVRNEEKGIISNVHTSTFDIDENALEIGPGLMAWLAVDELNN